MAEIGGHRSGVIINGAWPLAALDVQRLRGDPAHAAGLAERSVSSPREA